MSLDWVHCLSEGVAVQRVVTWNVDWWQRVSDQADRVPVVLEQSGAVWLLQELRNSAMTRLENSCR